MLHGSRFGSPYYGGGASTSLVPFTAPAALAGHAYILNWDSQGEGGPIRHMSVQKNRGQFDQSDAPGEQTISSEGLWRRVRESWHMGAGQEYCDRKESDLYRFETSFGIDPWTKWDFHLLPITSRQIASTNTNLFLQMVGTHMYWTDGQALRYTLDPFVFPVAQTTVTGTPAVAPSSITSDGNFVWIAVAASGVYRTTRGGAAAAANVTGAIGANSVLAYARGRVVLGDANKLYDITTVAYAGGALPAAHYTHPNTDYRFVAIAEGQDGVYALGFSGDTTLIHRMQLKSDGTGLDVPLVVAELRGEVGYSLHGLAGPFMSFGTDEGIRFAEILDRGLNYGARINTNNPVRCITSKDQFVWYGNEGMTANESGLGRMNLQYQTSDNVLAYANDLQARSTYAKIGGLNESYISAADNDIFDVPDIDIRVDVALDDWATGTNQILVSKWQATGNKRQYRVGLTGAGAPYIETSTNGTAIVTMTATANLAATPNGTRLCLRYTEDVNDGGGNRVANFYTGASIGATTWTNIGATVTTAGVTSIFSGVGTDAEVWIGRTNDSSTFPASGKFYAAMIHFGILGLPIAIPIAENLTLDTTMFTDLILMLHEWTLKNDSTILAEPFDLPVVSVVDMSNKRVFSVSGKGIYAESATDLEHVGYIQTGRVCFNIPDRKIGLFFDVKTQPIVASHNGMHEVAVSVDGADYVSLGQHTSHNQPFHLGEVDGNEFNFRVYILKDHDEPLATQHIQNWLFRSEVAPEQVQFIIAHLLINPGLDDLDANPFIQDPDFEQTHIEELHKSKEVVLWQEGHLSWPVIVEDFEILKLSLVGATSFDGLIGFSGTAVVKMKKIA